MLTINKFSERLRSYLSKTQVDWVRRSYYYAEQAHDGQTRHSGEPYITHPLEVASILADMHMDHHSLMAAMLHDVIEDTAINKSAIKKQFGQIVADLVDGVSKLTSIHFEDKTLAQAENFQKMALAMAKDIRVILVKLSDRLHNMRTLDVLRPSKRRRIARETLEIYVPIANRLGMRALKIELEDLGFKAMYPMRSRMIKKAVNHARGHRKNVINDIKKAISIRLKTEKLHDKVLGREKHLFSIYRKMREKSKSFNEIMDMFAFRIIVPTVDNCYRTLGIVHNLYKPIPGRFKDYIAIPKANGYQSLHTCLFGMHGIPIEIQIRTKEMDDMANQGIAAHWLYKSSEEVLSGSHTRTREWLKGVLELQQNAGDSLEFIENVKIDLFPDEVYIFSPKGVIYELPKNATAVDFAYAVHSEVGNTCIACRIDKRLASLSQPLQSGQTVEILTDTNGSPNIAWLNFVLTGKARSGIRHFLKHQKKNESINLGKRLLNKVLTNFGTDLKNLEPKLLSQQLDELQLLSLDHLLEEIGLGNQMAYIIAKKLVEPTLNNTKLLLNLQKEKPLTIRGTEGMVVNFAKCCYPIPGDLILGHVSSGRGIVIHTESCNNIIEIRQTPEKILEVNWDKNLNDEFTVALNIELEYHRCAIANLATSVTENEGNIVKISIEERNTQFSIVALLITVKHRFHLAMIIKKLRAIKEIHSITRKKE